MCIYPLWHSIFFSFFLDNIVEEEKKKQLMKVIYAMEGWIVSNIIFWFISVQLWLASSSSSTTHNDDYYRPHGKLFFLLLLGSSFFLWFTVEKRLDVVVRWFDDKTFSRRIRRLVRCSLSIRFIGRSKWIELVIKKRGKCVGARWQCTQKKTCSVGKSLENHTQNSRAILSSIGAFAGRATRAGAT